jgi:hypothetical protein
MASTAWAFFVQNGKNPFKLGGATRWFSLPGFKAAVDAIVATQARGVSEINQSARQAPVPQAGNSAADANMIRLLNQLKIADPSAAKGSGAFQDILAMGASAYPSLKGIVLNRQVSTDSLKWTAYLAAKLAPSDDEANAFVNKVRSGPFADYVKVEAGNGLNDRTQQKSSGSASNTRQEAKIISLLNQLKIADPSAAHGSEAFQNILNMGHDAYPVLEGIVLNHKVSTDPLKWAAYLAAYLAPSNSEARAFVDKIRNGAYADYVRVEANNGLNDRAMLNSDINGGIDLSQQDAALHVVKDINGGVKVNVDPALIARIEREGLPEIVPVIINMQPADIQSLFGVGGSI